MKSLIVLMAALSALSAGCTDAERASLFAYGDEADIACYSGGKVIFSDKSTGKITQLDGDGITYRSKISGGYVRAYADCIVLSGAE